MALNEIKPSEVNKEALLEAIERLYKEHGAPIRGIYIFESKLHDVIFEAVGRKDNVDTVGLIEWVKMRIYTDAKGLTATNEKPHDAS